MEKAPLTPEGRAMAEAVVQTAIEHGDTPSPCEFLAWEGELFGRRSGSRWSSLRRTPSSAGRRLNNEIVVHKQNIMGIPRTSRWEEAFSEGVTTGIRFIDAFAALAAYEIEVAAMAGKESETRARIVRSPADINIKIHPALERYITSYKHKMDLRGPVFTTVQEPDCDMKDASANADAKKAAGESAAGLVKNGMVVGLGTGSTVAWTIKRLGERVREEGLDFLGVPTSFQAEIWP